MFTALFSFLGGSAFRLVFGAVMDYFDKKQVHSQEMELQRLQAELEDGRHVRDMAKIQLQADLGVKEIQVMGEVAEQKVMADAFLEAVKGTSKDTGVWWVNAWNGVIRPAGATVSLMLWIGSVIVAYWVADASMIKAGLVLTEFDKGLVAAFLGVFVGDRIHTNSKK